jgi:predicted dinucleotide-binding enzyme
MLSRRVERTGRRLDEIAWNEVAQRSRPAVGDDDAAAGEIGALAEKLGFAPIKLGGLSEGGLLVQARGNSWGQLIFKDLISFES